jgi:hypothetical protein
VNAERKRKWAWAARCCLAALLAAGLAPVTGCEEEEFDYRPPEGYGALVIDNNTADDLYVFVDGVRVTRVGDGSEGFVDLLPGLYRVVLDGEDSRSYRDDLDVLRGRLTVLHVSMIYRDRYSYDVSVEFD